MRNVMMEYAGSVVSMLGAISFLVMLGQFFLGKEGVIAFLIIAVLGGI